jgi:hypothetical protein
MKNIFILFITLLCTAINISAQDIIYKNNNETINAKIVEVTETVIKYKDFDYQEGPIRNISIAHVNKIRYQNGKEEIFAANQAAKTGTEDVIPISQGAKQLENSINKANSNDASSPNITGYGTKASKKNKKGAFELVAGINFTLPELKAKDYSNNTLSKGGYGNGFKAGINYNYFAGRNGFAPRHLKVGTGLNYQAKNAEFFEDGNSLFKINLNYLTVPLYVRVSPFRSSPAADKFFIEFISEFDYLVSSKFSVGKQEFTGKDAALFYRPFNYSTGISIGYWFLKLQYNILNSNVVSDKFKDALSSDVSEFSIKPFVITFTVAFEL